MQQKTPLFFSHGISNTNNQKESPLEHATKTIEALIAYNKSLMSRLIFGSQQEILEYSLSTYLGIDEIPAIKIQISEKNITTFRKEIINQLINDLKIYEKIKSQLDKNDLDAVYQGIIYANKTTMNGLQENVTPEKVMTVMSLLFTESEARRKTRQIIRYMRNQSNKFPLLVEYNILNDLLKTLGPQLSPECNRVSDNINFAFTGTFVVAGLSQYEFTRLEKKQDKYLKEYSSHPLLDNLIQNYCALIKNNEANATSDIFDGYLKVCSQMKRIYQLEAQIDEIIRAEIIKTRAENQSQEKKNTVSLSKVAQKKRNLPQLNTPESKLETPIEPCVVLTNELPQSETVSELLPLPGIETAVDLPQTETATELLLLPGIETAVEESVAKLTETNEMLPTLAIEPTETVINSVVKEGEEIQEEPEYIYQPFYKKTEKQIKHIQNNTMNLKDDDKETYLKVFGLMTYESINLRALVNLTLNFGGQIETTGANRCRIKIKNIYAFIAVPQEALERACNSATITMHGGGHRSTRSQNHDRENAPQYLIEQFKDALVRAGFTPVNLGLSVDTSALTPSCMLPKS